MRCLHILHILHNFHILHNLYILPLFSHFIKNNPAKWLEDRFALENLKTEKVCAKYYACL